MTREEIERSFQYNMTNEFIKWDKAVNAEYKEENEEAFYQGAYAAQKYLIEKACEWLYNNFYEHPHEKNFICSENFSTIEDIVSRFQTIMKE